MILPSRGDPPVRRYRTEIVIPEDRLVALQLPTGLPTGRAVVTVQVLEVRAAGEDAPEEPGGIEWWDEFGEAPEGDEPWGLSVRLAALEP
jgi:hypothetical protein